MSSEIIDPKTIKRLKRKKRNIKKQYLDFITKKFKLTEIVNKKLKKYGSRTPYVSIPEFYIRDKLSKFFNVKPGGKMIGSVHIHDNNNPDVVVLKYDVEYSMLDLQEHILDKFEEKWDVELMYDMNPTWNLFRVNPPKNFYLFREKPFDIFDTL